jgi:ribosomal protein L18E
MANHATQSDRAALRTSERIWREIAEQLRQEKQDPEKMVELWRELHRAMLESRRRRIDPKTVASARMGDKNSRIA